MSTLLIEGGHRLQGRVAVEGNKNAALPLLAACLLTEEECVLTNVPRIGDVEVMARLLLDVGAEVDGIGSTTLRVRAPQHSHARARPLAGRPPSRGRCCCSGHCWRGRARAHRAAGWRLSGAAHDLDASRGAGGDGRAAAGAAIMRSKRRTDSKARRCTLRGVGDRHGDRAARRRAAPGVTEIRHAATEPHVVELCQFLERWAQVSRAPAARTPRRRRRAPARRRASTRRRLHRGRKLGGGRRDHRRRDGNRRRARRGHRGGGRSAAAHERRVRHARRRLPREAVTAEGGTAHHHRPLAGVPATWSAW